MMWTEIDNMMQLLDTIHNGNVSAPLLCPECKSANVHFLMHRHETVSKRGTAWIWCADCKNYAHFAYAIPEWWKNPDFIDEEKLDALPDYPNSLCVEIDTWVESLLTERANAFRNSEIEKQ